MAAAISLFLSLIGTKFLIDALTKRELGQPIHEDLPGSHQVKAGTPTMGGLAIVTSATLAYIISDLCLLYTSPSPRD